MKRKAIAVLFIFLNLVVPRQDIEAKETVGIAVSKIVIDFTDEHRYILELRVKEGGYALDGSMPIKDGIVEYELPLETQKRFKIESNPGYQLKDIKYEYPELGMKRSIIEEIKNDSITLDTVSTHAVVTVEFEKREGLQTGDTTKVKVWIVGILLVVVGGCMVVKKKKEESTYNME